MSDYVQGHLISHITGVGTYCVYPRFILLVWSKIRDKHGTFQPRPVVCEDSSILAEQIC